MQNVSYHVKAELISSVSWRKDIVLKWPEDRDSAHSAAILLEIAKTVSKHYNKHVFSETAEREQSTLFRSYHLTIVTFCNRIDLESS